MVNSSSHREYLRIKVAEHRRIFKVRCVDYKGGRCSRCGYNKYPAALEFHHRDPRQKDFHMGAGRTMSWEKAVVELDKCDLVCSNCHKEVHEDLRQATVESHRQYLTDKSRKTKKVAVACAACGRCIFKHPSQAERYKTHFCNLDCRHKRQPPPSMSSSRSSNTKITWPSDTDLQSMIWSSSVLAVSKRLNVSDQAVRKRCRRLGIPTPPIGHHPPPVL